jgi:hypothetical protein
MPDIAGVYTATTSVVLTPPSNKWWLKDMVTDLSNVTLAIERFSITPREDVGVFDGVGRDDPVTASDGRKGWQINADVRVDSQADYEKLDALLKTGRVLLLQDGSFPREWYVKLVKSGSWEQIRAVDPTNTYPVRWLYRMNLEFVTTKAP